MTKKKRTILFLIFLFLFVSIAPSAILYSQGYRFDFENKKLTQTGGLFIKAKPKQVEIYVDGKFIKKTDFFFGSALVENLLPKKYKIEVKKEGYSSWRKKLEISEKEVTEVKNLVLFPQNLNFNILTREVENLWFSPDEEKIILMEREEEGWALKLYDLEKNIKSYLIQEVNIYSKGGDLMNLGFSEDSKEIYLDVGIKEQDDNPPSTLPAFGWAPKYFTLRLDKSPPQLIKRKVSPALENVITSQKINDDFYYLDSLGKIFKNGVELPEKSFPVQPETKYTLKVFQDFVFLGEGENLYLFSSDSKSFRKFFDKIKDLKISPDKKKLVFFSNSEIWILFLKNDGRKKAGEKLFLVRLSEKIGNIFWLNSDYLIFNSGSNLKIVEIDDRDRIQTWDITSTVNFEPGTEIYFNGSNKKLYVLSQGNLYNSDSLLK